MTWDRIKDGNKYQMHGLLCGRNYSGTDVEES
jgi:hypothetical protein